MKVKLQTIDGVRYVQLPVPEEAIPISRARMQTRFDPELVKEIKRKRKEKVRLKVLAYDYGVSICHLRRLLAKPD